MVRGSCEECGGWIESTGYSLPSLCSRCLYLPGKHCVEVIPEATPENVAGALRAFRYNFNSERELQDGLARALETIKWSFTREAELHDSDGPAGRIDFMVGPGVGIEVKIDGSETAVIRQVHRYAGAMTTGCARLNGIVLVTSRRFRLPSLMQGIPVHVLWLQGGLL